MSLLDPNAQGTEHTSKFTSPADDRKNCDQRIGSISVGSSRHSEEKNILLEHFRNYPSNTETAGRNSQESKKSQATRSLEHCSQKVKINTVFDKL